MRAACLQQSIAPCKPEENLSRGLHLAGAALAKGAEVLVFPELFLTGFCYEPLLQSGPSAEDRPPYSSLNPFRALAEEHGCLIIGSIRSGGLNLGFCLDREGIDLRPKIHPFGEEREHFSGGDFISPVDTKWGRIGLQICYDLRFPVWSRNRNDYDLALYPASWPEARVRVWETLLKARAIENQCYVAGCSRTGIDGNGIQHNGHSLIIDPKGEVIAQAGDNKEDVISAELSITVLQEFRKKFNVFRDSDEFGIKM